MSINDIKNELAGIDADNIDGLKSFINSYMEDTRAGVVSMVKKAGSLIEKYESEVARTEKMYTFEKKYTDMGYKCICGIDEVGRGPLAGPVVACAAVLPMEVILYLNDSKQVKKAKREELYDILVEKADYGIGVISWERIDEINILQATYEAMRLAIDGLKNKPDILLNDAVKIPQVDIKQVPIIKGDTLSASIAAASIIAKVTRDRMMEEYDNIYPGYGFASNAGYGAASHIEAIKAKGPSPIHRRTFIKNFI